MPLPHKPTRNSDTIAGYERRMRNLLLRCRREIGLGPHEVLDPRRFVGWLVGNKNQWSRPSWRQNKAAAVHGLEKEAVNSDVASEALEALLPIDVEGCVKKSTKTSARKLKRFPLREYRQLDRWLDDHPGAWNEDVRRWLAAGLLTGLRPVEWGQARMETRGAEPALIVKNAKATNQRAHGPNRTILLGGLTDDERALISKHLARATEWSQAGQYSKFYHGCAAVLSKACRNLWPKRPQHPTLYSTRHQFSADAKASGLLPEELAALMGHAVDTTAARHYGRRVSGLEMLRVRPDPAEVSRVRQVMRMKHREPKPTIEPSPSRGD